MNIEKIKKDLKIVFEKEIKNFKDIDSSELTKYSYLLNGIIKEILNSYYFENEYKTKLIRSKETFGSIYLLEVNLKNNDKEKLEGFFSDRFFASQNGQELETYKVSDDYDSLINNLKDNSDYKKIFETNEMRKSLYLKEKHVVDYIVIDLNNDLEKFYKINKVDNKTDLLEKLREVDLDICIPLIKDSEYFVFAYNSNGMLGFASVQNNSIYDGAKINSINYLKTRKEFRGQNIATKIFEEIKKHSSKNNHILEINNISRISRNINLDKSVFKEDYILNPINTSNRNMIDIVLKKIFDWDIASNVIKYLNKKDVSTLTLNYINEVIDNMSNKLPLIISEEINLANLPENKVKNIFGRFF